MKQKDEVYTELLDVDGLAQTGLLESDSLLSNAVEEQVMRICAEKELDRDKVQYSWTVDVKISVWGPKEDEKNASRKNKTIPS